MMMSSGARASPGKLLLREAAGAYKTSGSLHLSLGRAVSHIVREFVDVVEQYIIPSTRYKIDIEGIK